MSSFNQAQYRLNERFYYKSDNGESWNILKSEGAISGDCEDYSLTLVWLAQGKGRVSFWLSLITMKYVLWFCKSPSGVGHLILWVRGEGWTDNIQKRIFTKAERKKLGYKLKFPYLFPLVLLKFIVSMGSKA